MAEVGKNTSAPAALSDAKSLSGKRSSEKVIFSASKGKRGFFPETRGETSTPISKTWREVSTSHTALTVLLTGELPLWLTSRV